MSVFWRPNGCVLWFDFAELSGNKVYDLSGNGNHGNIYGASWRRGQLIGSLYFDGVDDYVEVLASDILNGLGDVGKKMSVEVLVYLDEVKPEEDYFVFKLSEWTIGYDSDGYLIFATWGDRITCATKAKAKEWMHLVANWYAGDHYEFYINAVEDANSPKSTTDTSPSTTNPIGIMASIGLPTEVYTHGYIALVRIYNRALTEREIRAHYNYIKYMARQIIR